jgi:hypothetical protein
MYGLLIPAQDFGDALALGGGMMVVAIIAGIAFLAIWIWALVNAIQNPALDSTMRMIWVLVIVFTGIIGAAVYLLVGRDSTSTAART